MKQTFRKELLSGKTLIGTVVTLPSSQLAEILAHVGFDWLWILLGVVLDLMKWSQIAANRRGIPGYPESAY